MHCMLMDLLHGFEVLSTTEETFFFYLLTLSVVTRVSNVLLGHSRSNRESAYPTICGLKVFSTELIH